MDERIELHQLIADLKTHLSNMERFAVAAHAAGRVEPVIEQTGPGHEHMANTIRRLGSGQTCTMSLRYLREIIRHLEELRVEASYANFD